MAIAKNPKRNHESMTEQKANAFITGATGQGGIGASRMQNKKPIMIRIDPDMLGRIDRAAKRLGISRSAFIVSSAAMRLEDME